MYILKNFKYYFREVYSTLKNIADLLLSAAESETQPEYESICLEGVFLFGLLRCGVSVKFKSDFSSWIEISQQPIKSGLGLFSMLLETGNKEAFSNAFLSSLTHYLHFLPFKSRPGNCCFDFVGGLCYSRQYCFLFSKWCRNEKIPGFIML